MITLSQTIRPATVEDLPRLDECARQFYASSKSLKGWDLARFVMVWTGLLASSTGVIYLLLDSGAIVGTIGGIKYPDIYSGRLVATEFFWFVIQDSRGGGLALYKQFEGWAKAQGCEEIRMVHLSDSMPERLRALYSRMGFRNIETLYAKDLA